MKIILYNPPSSAGRKPILPFSLLAVGAVLEGHFAYAIVDGNLESDPLAVIASDIGRHGANRVVLACTVMPGPQLQQVVPLCRELKRRHPDLIVVWGGYFPTQHWDVCLRSELVDYVVRGHGELVFRQLLTHLNTGLPALGDLPGLAYRSAPNVPRSNPLAALPHPKDLPAFNFDRVAVPSYIRRTFLGSRTLGYHSSYGCPFFCNFCAVVNLVNGKWLPQTAAQVADVMERYVRHWGVNAVEFYDNNFFVHEARVAEFAERIQPLGLKWWGEARIDTLLKFAPSTWRLMRDSGLRMVFMGAESGSAETLKRMDKGGTQSGAQILRFAERMQRVGIVPEYSFVLGFPAPTEREVLARIDRDIASIRKVKDVNPDTEIIIYVYSPVPVEGSELYERTKAEGFRFPEKLEDWLAPQWESFDLRKNPLTPWLTPRAIDRIRDFETVLNGRYPTATDVRLSPAQRSTMRTLSALRYRTGMNRWPYEIKALQKLWRYRQPETEGFPSK